jgi:hypothetical protein
MRSDTNPECNRGLCYVIEYILVRFWIPSPPHKAMRAEDEVSPLLAAGLLCHRVHLDPKRRSPMSDHRDAISRSGRAGVDGATAHF